MPTPGPHAFDALAEDYDFLARTTAAVRFGDLLALLPDRRDRALDVGCGTGLLAVRLAEDFRHVVGMDVSPAMIAVAERRRTEERCGRVRFVLADMHAPPWPERSFDLVVSTYALHRARVEETLGALRRLPRRGGRMILVVPTATHPRLAAWAPVQVAGTLRAVPGYLRSYGAAAAWRLVRFRMSPGWRGLVAAGRRPTPAEFRAACTRALPGCTFRAVDRWAMTAVWDPPR